MLYSEWLCLTNLDQTCTSSESFGASVSYEPSHASVGGSTMSQVPPEDTASPVAVTSRDIIEGRSIIVGKCFLFVNALYIQ